MESLRAFFDRKSLTRAQNLLHGSVTLALAILTVIVYFGLLDLFPLAKGPNSIEYRHHFMGMMLFFLLMTAVSAMGTWFFGALLRPLSWYTPWGVLLMGLGTIVVFFFGTLAGMAYGQVVVPGGVLFGN